MKLAKKNINATLSVSTDGFKNGVKSASTSLDSLRNNVKSTNSSMRELGASAQASKWKNELTAVNVDLAQSKSNLSNIKVEQQQTIAAVQKARSTVNAVKLEQEQLNQKIKTGKVSTEDAAKKQEQLNSKLKQANTTLEQAKLAQQEVKVRIDSTKAAISEIKAKQEQINQRLAKTKEHQEKVKVKISESNAELSNAKARVSQIQSEYGKFNQRVAKSEQSLSGVKDKLGGITGKIIGVVTAYASFSGVKKFISDSIQLANEQTSAEKRVETTMSNVKGTTLEQIAAIKSYSSELQSLTTIGDEVSITGASQLATFQLQADTIKTLMPALSDLAVAQNGVAVSSEQMQSMANLVGKVMNGSTSALTRYGVVMNDTQSKILKTGTESQKAATLVEVLKQNFGGLAESMAKTPEGRVQQLKNAWGDMQEVVGAKVYPALTKTLTYITEKIPTIQSTFSTLMNTLQPGLEWVTSTALPAVGSTIGTTIKWIEKIAPVIKPLLPTIAKIAVGFVSFKAFGSIAGKINNISNSVKLLSSGFSALKGAGGALKSISAMGSVLSNGSGVIKSVGSALTLLGSPIGITITAISALVAIGIVVYKNWDVIKEKAGQCWNAIKGFFGGVGEWFGAKWNAVKEGAMSLWDGVTQKWEGIKEKASGMWDNFKNAAGVALDATKTYLSPKLDSIKQVYEEHGGGFKGVAAGIMEGVKQYYSVGFDALNTITGGKAEAILSTAREKFNAVKDSIVNAFNSAKDAVSNIFDSIKNKVSSVWEGIKNLIKTPHIVQRGTISIAGINTPIPNLGIEWNAKGGIFNRPTVLPTMSGLQGFGEAGAEAVLPLSLLWSNMGKFIRGALTQPASNGDTKTNNKVNINIYAENKSVNQITNELVPALKAALANM